MKVMQKNLENRNFSRVNFQIKCPSVRVIQDDRALGVMPTDQARKLAQDQDLDLVEVAPQAKPPVCHIVNYEKYLYEQKLREKEQQKRQKESLIELKEVRLRPGIQDHDIDVKMNQIKKFISENKKVQISLMFKHREITHKDEGFRVINKIIASLSGGCIVEQHPRMEGNRLICKLAPKVEK